MGGDWVKRGEAESGAKGLWRASRGRGLDALVAETARGGILRNGLGFSSCDVSVVTNVYEDHLGLGGIHSVEQMAEVKAILPQCTRPSGATILNLDQPLVRRMAGRTPAPVVFFSVETPPTSVENCFYLHDNTIFRRRGATCERVIAADRIYLSHGGAVAFQLVNAMIAIAVIEALQSKLPVERASLEKSLGEFGRMPGDLPRRLQLFRYQGFDVLLSSTKNPVTYDIEIPLIRRLARAHGYRRLVAVVSEVGNRQERRYREVSRAVGEFGDTVVCLPPHERYLRGRTGEEIVHLLGTEVPEGKLLRPSESSLSGVFAHFEAVGTESTLFVLFASGDYAGPTVEDVQARGEKLPLRFDA